MPYMPASSRETLRVRYDDPGATAYMPELAIVPVTAGEPADSDYHAATWDGQDAKLLIGAGTDVALSAGTYVVWTRLAAGAERPVRRSGLLTVGST